MTATAEFISPDANAPTVAPVRMANGARMVVRAAQRLIGAALILAALVLWLAPGASWESDVMLFKLILSITGGLAGLGLLQSSATPKTPEIQIDTIRREVRLVRVLGDDKSVVVQRCAFSELARAERDGTNVRFWDSNDVLLAEVTMTDRAEMKSLMSGLKAAGKIA